MMPGRRGARRARAGVMSGSAGSGPTAANAPAGDSAGVKRARPPGGRHVRRDHAPAMPTGAGSGPTAANAPGGDSAGVIRAGATVRRAGSRNRPESPRPPARTGHGPDPAAASALPPGDGRTRRRRPAMGSVPGAHGDRRGEPNRRGPEEPIDGSMVEWPAGPGSDGPTVRQLPPHHRATPDQVATAAAADRSGTGDTGARTRGPPTGMDVNRAAGERGTSRAITIAVKARPRPPARRLPSSADQPSARRGLPAGAGDRELAAELGMRRATTTVVAASTPADRPVDVGIRAPGRPAIRSSCCGLARRRRRS